MLLNAAPAAVPRTYVECIVLMQDEVAKATNCLVSVCVLASHETTYTIYQVWQLFRPPLHCLFQYVILRLACVVGPLVGTWTYRNVLLVKR